MTATLTRTPPPRSRRTPLQQSLVVQVVDVEQTSISEHDDQDPEPENSIKAKPGTQKEVKTQIEPPDKFGESFQRLGVCSFILCLTLIFLMGTTNLLEQFNEVQILILSILPVLVNWFQRIQAPFKRRKGMLKRVVFLGLRLTVLYWVLTTVPLQTTVLIFQHDRGLLPITSLCTILTLFLHFLIRPGSSPDDQDLAAPDFEARIPVGDLKNPEEIKKLENRVSMSWLYFGEVLVLPLLQEVVYRGVIVGSFGFFFRSHIAAAIGALCFNCSRSYEMRRTYFSRFVCGVIWGMLFLATNGNLMYPFVAHLMHNAILFGIYHFDTITECF